MSDHREVFEIPRPVDTGAEPRGVVRHWYRAPEGGLVGWSNADPLPEIGARVRVRLNRLGLATVTGYFASGVPSPDGTDDWVGVMTRLDKPPRWLRDQNKRRIAADDPQWMRNNIGCEFGAEITVIK